MKKTGICFLLLLFAATSAAYPLESKLFNMRNKIFQGSQEIKPLLAGSRDAAVLTSMFDSCIIAVSQMDAYFGMLGIFETIPKEQLTRTAVDFLENWLNQVKKTNDLNISFLKGINIPVESSTRDQAQKLIGYFGELNNWIDKELVKLSIVKKTAMAQPPAPGGTKKR